MDWRDIPRSTAIAAGLVTALVGASHLFTSNLIGVCAIAMASAAAFTRSFDIAVTALVWGLALLMFGPAGAGCLVLAQSLVTLLVRLAPDRAPPMATLVAMTGLAAVTAVLGAPLLERLIGAGGRPAAELVCILAIGAPGLALGAIARTIAGAERFEAVRVAAAAPLLVGVVLGAGVWGLNGVAAMLAVGWLAPPMIALVGTLASAQQRHEQSIHEAFGVLATGLVAVFAMGVAADFLHPALTIMTGIVAGASAARIHAPGIAGGIAYGFGADPALDDNPAPSTSDPFARTGSARRLGGSAADQPLRAFGIANRTPSP
jgi:hypothetical protein